MLTYGAHKPDANDFSSLNVPRVQSRNRSVVEIEKLVQTCHMTSLHCETSFVHCKLVFSCPNESNIDQKKDPKC